MATNEQVYTTRILLNSEQAKNEIVTLQKKVDELRKKRDEAWKAGDVEKWKKLGKEIEKDEKKMFVEVAGDRRIKDVEVLQEDGTYAPIDPNGEYTLASHNYMLKQGGDAELSKTLTDNLVALVDKASEALEDS